MYDYRMCVLSWQPVSCPVTDPALSDFLHHLAGDVVPSPEAACQFFDESRHNFTTLVGECRTRPGAGWRGRRHGFLGRGRIVSRWLTYLQNTIKTGKGTGFGPLHSRICRGRPLINLTLGRRVPSVPPPVFNAHAG